MNGDRIVKRAPKGRGNRILALMQFAPLLVVFFFVTACSGTGDGTGDILTSRRSNVFLKAFISRPGNANTPDPDGVTSWAPFVIPVDINGNQTGRSTGFTNTNASVTTLLYDDVFAQLEITNGMSARLDQILLEFTEVDGTPILDFTVTPPAAVPGRFDYPVRGTQSLIATPLTSIGAPLTEPGRAITRYYIPINIFQSGIYEFLLGQPVANKRPFLCRLTFTGVDILDNPFSIVSFLMVSPVLQTPNRTQPAGGGGIDRPPATGT